MQPLPAEPDETTNTLATPAYRANNDPPGCSISLVIKGHGATEQGHFVVDFGVVQVTSVLAYKGTTSHAGAYQEARVAAWTWHDHAETTYAITVDPAHEAASDWFVQANEADLTRTLASARDLARDLGVPLILRDAEGFLRGHVDADGGYCMVDCETHDLSATRSLIPSVLRGFARSANILGTEWGFGDMVTAWTSCPPPSAADHLLRQINSEWSETKRRAIAVWKELERLQQRHARARTPTTKERALTACRMQNEEYSRLCAECDALEAHAEKVRPFSKPAEE